MKNQIKIIIADDHPIFRRGLRLTIESEPDFEVIGEAANGEEVLQLLEKETADVIILDLDMPILDGIETARTVHAAAPQIKLIFLTLHKDKQVLNSLKKLHVQGYLLKDSAIVEITDCIRQVVEGKPFISSEVLEMLLHVSEQGFTETPVPFSLSNLTPAEKRILRLIAETKRTREIAEDLCISARTVENHRFNICSKLHLKGNHSLIKFALENKKLIFAETEK